MMLSFTCFGLFAFIGVGYSEPISLLTIEIFENNVRIPVSERNITLYDGDTSETVARRYGVIEQQLQGHQDILLLNKMMSSSPQDLLSHNFYHLKYLYTKYATDLVRIRSSVKPYIAHIQREHGYWGVQSNDLEMEIVYMRLRELSPKRVIEFSPCRGYSTFWLLAALHDNGGDGYLESYDLVDDSTRAPLPQEYRKHWKFTQGDVFRFITPQSMSRFDYFHIDSEHTVEFGAKYTLRMLLPHSQLFGQTWGSVHDIFPYSPAPLPEALPVIDWLQSAGKGSFNFFTVSPRANPAL